MKKHKWFWAVAILSLVLDQLTKDWVLVNFDQGESWAVWHQVLHFTYVRNTGAAFSSFRGGAFWLKWLSLGASIVLIWLGFYGPRMKITEQLGYGFILAGALGNGIDRFRFEYVIDFIDIRIIKFPVFNIADTCINIGIIFLLIATFFVRKSTSS